jgi:hypothetical protein
MIAVELSPDSIVIDIDAETGTVTLTEMPADLLQLGLGAGTACSEINGQPAVSFLDAGALPLGSAMEWAFVLGDRIIRLLLVFEENFTESLSGIALAAAAASKVDEAISADFDEPQEATWDHPNADTAWRDPRPVFQNLAEYPVEDAAPRVRERPPRPLINNWKGWWSEPDDPPKEWWMT